MPTPRERRLLSEFERMKALQSPYCLFDFLCADLKAAEATEFLHSKTSFDVIRDALPDFLEPEEFEQLHPGVAPEKYLILYTCEGLVCSKEGIISKSSEHMMEVVFGWRYPTEAPTFIWHTDIWHPNFKTPYICIEGRSFAVGLTLDQIVPEVGRMIQYQNYNIKDPLNRDAAEWAEKNSRRFPVDDRDIMDGRKKVTGRRERPAGEPLVELMQPGKGDTGDSDLLIEMIELDSDGGLRC